MGGDTATWGVVLAGGSGRRLGSLTADATGTPIPKQYCSVFEGPSLLRATIARMQAVVEPNRILVVVAAAHRRWWEPELADLPPENTIVQPCDRGTACGLLLPLFSILHRDPGARVVVAPSDHYVRDEATLATSLLAALAHLDDHPGQLLLLGMQPDRPDTEYGWITPSPGGARSVRSVTAFVEKPDPPLARQLMSSGALWSSFTFVATGEALMEQFRRSLPWLVERFTSELAFISWDRPHHVLLRLYDRLPTVDFSSRVLQQSDRPMHVLAVPPCGWTDLGTPQRLIECIRDGSQGPGPDEPWSLQVEPRATSRRQPGGVRSRPAALDLARAADRAIQRDLQTAS